MQVQRKIFTAFILLLMGAVTYAQDPAMKILNLDDLSVFRPQAGNWQIVGDVTMNPNIDTHRTPAPPPVETKKGKKSKAQPVPEIPKAVTFAAGKGILLNINDDVKKDQLITSFEHGDIEM